MSPSSAASAASPQPADPSATPAQPPSAMARVRAIWVNRRILRILIIRDLKVRYSNSVLGFAWTLLDPLLLTLVYWLVFGLIVSRGAANEQPYLLWLLTGILPFQWTSHVIGDAGRLLGGDAKLVTASSLPREIWVLRAVSARFVEFLFTLPITALAMLLFGIFTDYYVGPSAWIWLIPAAFAVQFVFNIGIALMLSPMSMLYPDVHRFVKATSRLYRYLSPVIYGLATLQEVISSPERNWPEWMLFGDQTWPEWLMTLYELNPMVGILNVYHAVIFPENTTDVAMLLGWATVLSIGLVVVGWRIFRRLEPRVLKEL